MLKRTVDEQLSQFLKSHEKKCLMVRGARQVGKTYSVDHLGSTLPSYISINFLRSPRLKAIFSGDLDVDTLVFNFSVYLPEKPFIPGKTVLFLDEIQECPEAISSLKFWAADGRYQVIASGSMLGVDYKRPSSFPVGSIRYLDMYPLSFQEFLTACGVGDPVLQLLRQCFQTRQPVPEPVHQKMLQYLKQYMVIGGMPEVVQDFVDHHNAASADRIQRSILRDYRYDIAHYAPASVKEKAEKCFFSLPEQLGKENHKFQYAVVEKGGSKRKFETCLDWLSAADLIEVCHAVTTVEFPLRSFIEEDNFRVYAADTGLFTAMYDPSLKTALLSESEDGPSLGQAKGALYESLIACMLRQNGHRDELYFYKNDTTKMEIEFLIPSESGVIPIEVKAGNNRSKSLDRLLKDKNIPFGVKLISGNVGAEGKKVTLPLYMAMFL